VSRIYRKEGIKDGEIASTALSHRDKQFIVKVLSAQEPYKKWSRFQRVTVLNDHFISDPISKVLIPRFMDLMDGNIFFDDWVNIDSPTNPYQAEDRRGEMSWSYIEGCFEGVVLADSKEMKGNGDI